MNSIMSYPKRGSWGDPTYRGNTSGYVIKHLIQYFHPINKPKKFIEVFSGGGTGKDVATDLGIKNSIHLDLNNGWNALKDDIPSGSDFVFSHPPYWDIISYQKYNNNHIDDISQNMSYEEFISKLDNINAKIYQSLLNGGRHALLIGDVRKGGKYYSLIKDLTWFGELESHIIKIQHNCWSDNQSYTGNIIRIAHEHLLVFQKKQIWDVNIRRTINHNFDLRNFENITWRDLTQGALESLGGRATLNSIYKIIDGSKKTKNNKHWKEKIRQTLQIHNDFISLKPGVWGLNIT